MAAPLIDGRPGVYLKHSVHGGGTYFNNDPDVLAFYGARGWDPAEDPDDEDAEPTVSPESPAPKKTSKAAKAADKGEVTGG